MQKTNIFVLAAAAAVAATGALAQTTTFANETRAQDVVEDIEEQIEDSYERDVTAFGNAGRKLGWSGSLSATANMTSGNTDTSEFAVGLREGYFDGKNGHRITLAYSYGEANDVTNKDELLFGYDYTREFGTNTYFYGKLALAYDDFDSYKYDGFVGAGLGYRVFNTADTQWQIQAGPGYRYAENDAGEAVIEDVAASLSSYYSQRINPTLFLTNDTDVIWSETNTTVNNVAAVNVSMTDALALRTSLTTKYDSDPADGFKNTDNTLGMSIVYSIN